MDKNVPLVPSRRDEAADVLRARFEEYGYLYFPRYVAAAKCARLLDRFLHCLAPHIEVGETCRKPVLRGEPFFETDKLWDDVYPRLQSLHAFHNFFHEPDIEQLMRMLVDDDVFVYPMKMARISTPGKIGFETPPHQDAYSHQAGPTMAGIWVALHDVNRETGRLKLLPHSHKRGVREVFQSEGVGGVQCRIFPGEDVWHVSDVEQGDVIIFHSCCVHKAEPNTSSDAVRLSIDTRFCDYGAQVYASNLEPHHGWRIEGLDWPSIYRDWEDSELAFYWRDYPNVTHELREV
ncbi:MAG: phytanoyl-CoA dioxygenase family protein [Halioglobus sp.]